MENENAGDEMGWDVGGQHVDGEDLRGNGEEPSLLVQILSVHLE